MMVDWGKEIEDIEEVEQTLIPKVIADKLAEIYAKTGIWFGD